MPKPLNKYRKAALDERFVLYDPEQLLEGPDDLVDMVCAIHGEYQAQLKRLGSNYCYRHLLAP